MRRKHVIGCVCLFAVKNKRISNEVLIFGNTIHTRLSVSSGNPPSDLKATNLDHSKSRPLEQTKRVVCRQRSVSFLFDHDDDQDSAIAPVYGWWSFFPNGPKRI